MRIHLTFRNPYPRAVLPINYNSELARFIRNCIHDPHGSSGNRNAAPQGSDQAPDKFVKMYSFSQLIIPRREIREDKLTLCCTDFSWVITSPSPGLIDTLSLAIAQYGRLEVAGLRFPLSFIRKTDTPDFSSGHAAFTCLSPVTAYGFSTQHENSEKWPDRKFGVADEERFVTALRSEVLNRMQRSGQPLSRDFTFRVRLDENYLRRKKNRVTKLIMLSDSHGHRQAVRGVLSPLQIESEPEVLRFIYDTGLGRLTEFGFGMLEESESCAMSNYSRDMLAAVV